MQRVLFLDDDERRHWLFKQRNRHKQWKIVPVWSADEAILALKEPKRFDRVFLDHDLADFHYKHMGYAETALIGTGLDAAKFIAFELEPEKRPDEVVVHSRNDLGAARMVSVLNEGRLNVRAEPFDDEWRW